MKSAAPHPLPEAAVLAGGPTCSSSDFRLGGYGIARIQARGKALLGLPMLAAATPAGAVFLLGGAAMAFIYAPLQAQGKPLVRFFGSDGDGVTTSFSFLKAPSLIARGVPMVGSGDVGCCGGFGLPLYFGACWV